MRLVHSHLSEEELALFAEGLILGLERRLPGTMARHVAACFQCKQNLVGILELMDEADLRPTRADHPYFARENETK